MLTQDGFQIADTPLPPLMPGDVRIEIRSIGVCRTDLRIWKGQIDVALPLILGHEISGVIHESTVTELVPGTPVTTEIDTSCGICWYCQHRKRHLCAKRKTLGFDIDGGLAEYISVPGELVHVLPEGIDYVQGTFVSPTSIAIETYTRSTVNPHESVLVIGTGKMGLIVAQVFEAFGANVYLLGDNRWHMGVARQLGLRNIIAQQADWQEKLKSLTDVGPHIVVEATGTKNGLDTAIEVVRNDGTIALAGHHLPEYPLSPETLTQRELKIIGTFRGDYKMAIDMLQKGRIEVDRLVTKQFPLEQGAKAFEEACNPDILKVNINI